MQLFFFRLTCALISILTLASAQNRTNAPPPLSAEAARRQIIVALNQPDVVEPNQTVTALLDLGFWYRDILNEEALAAWKGTNWKTVVPVIDPILDARLAASIIDFSWRQRREAVFVPAYAVLLESIMSRYPGSARPVMDDLRSGPLPLAQPQRETICKILLDLPDVPPWKQDALLILPRYPQETEAIVARNLQQPAGAIKRRALQWMADLNLAALTPQARLLLADPDARVRGPAEATIARLGGDSPANAPNQPILRIGGNVLAPVMMRKSDPPYSEVARKLKASGSVLLSLAVWTDGKAHDVRVVRPLGYGLDEKAVETVSQWEFRPGTKDGQPVNVFAQVEVNFRLLSTERAWSSGAIVFVPTPGITPPAVVAGEPPGDAQEGNETAALEFTVDAHGAPVNIHSVPGQESSSTPDLIRTLATWKFSPALRNGEPVEAPGRIRFTKGSGSPQPQAMSVQPNIAAQLAEAQRLGFRREGAPLLKRLADACDAAGAAVCAEVWEYQGAALQKDNQPATVAEADKYYRKALDLTRSLGIGGAPLALALELESQALKFTGDVANASDMWSQAAKLRAQSISGMSTPAPPATASAGTPSQTTAPAFPRAVSRREPEFSEIARLLNYSGSAMIAAVVGTDGKAHGLRLVKGLGMGLDEQAARAIQQWEFEPGTRGGVPASVEATIEISFRLL